MLKIQIKWFDVIGGQFIHLNIKSLKFGFSKTMRTGKIQLIFIL